MTPDRCLIVNADDFGRSPGVNAGVAKARQHGILTSASLMVRWPAAIEAAAFARADPGLSVGLHLDLGEWAYRSGGWEPVYEVADLEDPAAVAVEVERQLASFRRLLGRMPTHLDSHQHVHLRDPVAAVSRAAAERLGVPLRRQSTGIHFCGDFYGQTGTGDALASAIGVERLIEIVRALPPGVTELACHPGEDEDFDSDYGSERRLEARTLCDPRVRSTLDAERIALISFAEIADDRPRRGRPTETR